MKLTTLLLNAMPAFLKGFLTRSHFVVTKKTLYKVFFVTTKCDLVRKPLRNAGIAFKSSVVNFNVDI